MTNAVASGGLVVLYLGAIVAANIISAHFGPKASIYNAFALIGLTLTTRDRLHDLWGRNRFRNMALLIAAGSALSFVAAHVFSGTAPPTVVARIALASCVAFAAAEAWDAIVYEALRHETWFQRVNKSNVVGAAVDSALFVSIAFGWHWEIIFGQWTAKTAGGMVWSFVIRKLGHAPEPQAAEARA